MLYNKCYNTRVAVQLQVWTDDESAVANRGHDPALTFNAANYVAAGHIHIEKAQ